MKYRDLYFMPLPTHFEKPEPVHRFTGKIFLEPGNYPVYVNRAIAHIYFSLFTLL